MEITNNYRCDRCDGEFAYEDTVELYSEVYCIPCGEIAQELDDEAMAQPEEGED